MRWTAPSAADLIVHVDGMPKSLGPVFVSLVGVTDVFVYGPILFDEQRRGLLNGVAGALGGKAM